MTDPAEILSGERGRSGDNGGRAQRGTRRGCASVLVVAAVLLQLAQWGCGGDELSDSHIELRVGVEVNSGAGNSLLCSGDCGISQSTPEVVDDAEEGGEGPGEGAEGATSSGSIQLSQPNAVQWGEGELCSLQQQTFTITNRGPNALLITRAYIDNVQFTVVNFQEGRVEVGDPFGITVEYLPHFVGPVEANLVVHTSRGIWGLQMYAVGVDSPYIALPLNGVKVPQGMVDTYDLSLYNPHSDVLHVKEIYTDQAFFHLRLFRNDESPNLHVGPADMWEVSPSQQKIIMQVEFKAVKTGVFSGRVVVVTDKDTIVIPVSIVAIGDGVHGSGQELDFGTLTFPEEHHTIPVSLMNAGPGAVEVVEVFSATTDPLLGIHFKHGLVLEGGTEEVIASATYLGTAQGSFSGKLLVMTNESTHTIELPYRARVVHGTFRYRSENATFEAKKGRTVRAELLLTNWFPVPVKLFSAGITDASFAVETFPHGYVLDTDAASPPIHILFTANSSDLAFTAQLLISTNVTVLSIPLKVMHGRLHYQLPQPLGHRAVGAGGGEVVAAQQQQQQSIDFGMIGVNEARTLSFNITNPNPVTIEITNIFSDMQEVVLRLDSVYDVDGSPIEPNHGGTWNIFAANAGIPPDPDESGNSEAFSSSSCEDYEVQAVEEHDAGNKASTDRPANGRSSVAILMLGPGRVASFTVEITASEQQQCSGDIVVVTPKERQSIPVLYQSLVGSLSIAPTMVRFEGCYPGMPRTAPLMARSTYTRSLTITAVTTSDPRLRLVLSNTTIPPSKRVNLGMLEFDAGAAAKQERLAEDSFDQSAAMRLALDGHLSLADEKTFRAREDAWRLLLHSTGGVIKATVTLHTDVAAGYVLNVRASLLRPSILTSEVLEFHKTEVGDSSLGVIQLTNPSPNPVAVALLEPQPSTGDSSPHSRSFGDVDNTPGFVPCSMCGSDSSIAGTIKCENCKFSGSGGSAGGEKGKVGRGSAFRLSPGAVLAAVIQPMQTLRLGPIEFAPHKHQEEPFTAVLPIRNNLTFVEMLELSGQGLSGKLQIRLMERDNAGPLHLNVTPEMVGLQGGRLPTTDSREQDWPLRTQFPFHAINLGNIQLTATNVYLLPIEGEGRPVPSCAVCGFQLQPCGSDGRFWLPPNQDFKYLMTYWVQRHTLRSAVRLVYEAKHGIEEFVIRAEVAASVVDAMHTEVVPNQGDAPARACAILLCLILGVGSTAVACWELRFDIGIAVETAPEEDEPAREGAAEKTALVEGVAEVNGQQGGGVGGGDVLNKAGHQRQRRGGKGAGKAEVKATEADAQAVSHAEVEGQDASCHSVCSSRSSSGGVGSYGFSMQSGDEEVGAVRRKAGEEESSPPLVMSARSEDTVDGLAENERLFKGEGRDNAEFVDIRSSRRRRRKKGSEGAGEDAAPLPPTHDREAPVVPTESPSPAIAPATPVSLNSGSPVKRRKTPPSLDDAAAAVPPPRAPASSPSSTPLHVLDVCAAAGTTADSSTCVNIHAARQAAAAAMAMASRRPLPVPATDTTRAARPPIHPPITATPEAAAAKTVAASGAVAGVMGGAGKREVGSQAPGAKRMAHAALLTPLQTSAHTNLGVILPAGSKAASTANSRSSGVTPTAHSGESGSGWPPHGAGLPSPGEALSPPLDGATPKSARRRRRPRRGGGGSSNPNTPVAEPLSELAAVPDEWLPAGGGTLLEELEPEGMNSSVEFQPLPLPSAQSRWDGGALTGVGFAGDVGRGSMPSLPDTLLPLPTPSTAASAAGTPLPIPGHTLDQLGATAGIPDSVYSIWGGSHMGSGGLMEAPLSSHGYQQQHTGSLFSDWGGGGGGGLPTSGVGGGRCGVGLTGEMGAYGGGSLPEDLMEDSFEGDDVLFGGGGGGAGESSFGVSDGIGSSVPMSYLLPSMSIAPAPFNGFSLFNPRSSGGMGTDTTGLHGAGTGQGFGGGVWGAVGHQELHDLSAEMGEEANELHDMPW